MAEKNAKSKNAESTTTPAAKSTAKKTDSASKKESAPVSKAKATTETKSANTKSTTKAESKASAKPENKTGKEKVAIEKAVTKVADNKANTKETVKATENKEPVKTTKAEPKTTKPANAEVLATKAPETTNKVKAQKASESPKTSITPATTNAEAKTNNVSKIADSKVSTKEVKEEKKAAQKEKPAKQDKPAKEKISFASLFAKNNADKKPENSNIKNSSSTSKDDKKSEKLVAMKTSDKSKYIRPKSNGNGSVATFFKRKNVKIFTISLIALLLVFILILSIVLSTTSKSNGNNFVDKPMSSVFDESYDSTYSTEYKAPAQVGYYGKILGNINRNIPKETKNEGFVDLQYYPKYGYTPKGLTETLRKNLISEAWQLCSINTRIGSDGYPKNTYNSMDEDGYLYLNGVPVLDAEGNHKQLYKHTSAEGMYYGNVSDDEPGIIKQVTMRKRTFVTHGMYNVTGVYAPAGEVIKIQISEKDMEATGGITIHIGQALYNSKANNIWLQKGQMQRFPVILNTMVIDKSTATLEKGVYTAYVGSYLGGPLYIRNESVTFSATISGGVTYQHFILGYTTPEEFEFNAKSSAPYFDMEIWDNGVLHSGPVTHAKAFSYDDLYKAAVLWDKITTVTTKGNNQNIVFLYDPFVAAGAAVAFPSQQAVNCPDSWMSNSLNYNTLIKSGAWGNLHEYHHNFQGFGVGAGGEVTNNSLTLVSYSLFTKISSNRGLGSYGAEGLGGWNSYTSATYALEEVLKIARNLNNSSSPGPSNGYKGLALYATLLHNFGQDAFIQCRYNTGGQDYKHYMKKWQNVTHYNMTYYVENLLKANDIVANSWNAAVDGVSEYPMFIPAASLFQTGRVYEYSDNNGDEERTIKTMQPYRIPYGEPFEIDLSPYELNSDNSYKSGSIIVPDDFEYDVVKVYRPENGTITKISQDKWLYTPSKSIYSGEIHVVLRLRHKTIANYVRDNNVPDIELILEFEQSHDLTGRMLERTVYEFEGETTYTEAVDAFNKNYEGYTNVTKTNNKNPVQNSNTDIWLSTDEFADGLAKNSIMEVTGKFYIDESAKYRFTIRGRGHVALYLSLDNGETYNLAAKHYAASNAGAGFIPTINNNEPANKDVYTDMELQADSWVYFKAIMVVSTKSFIGIGTGKFTPAGGTYDEEGNITSWQEESVSVGYANAYRENFKFNDKEFVADYFYEKKYTDNYSKSVSVGQTLYGEPTYQPWDNTLVYNINNLFDGDDNTYIHTNRNAISPSNPFVVSAKLETTVTANSLVFHGTKVKNGQYGTYQPKDFKVYISANGETWKLVSDKTNASANNYQVVAAFDDTYKFNYYKVEVTATHARNNLGYLALNKINFRLKVTNGDYLSPDETMFNYNGNWSAIQTYSTFGHAYVGRNNATMQFEFEGKYVMIKSIHKYDNYFEVYIDGVKVQSLGLPDTTTTRFYTTYMSPLLSDETHTIMIKCIGETTIDS
ncbi:MAG: M60 family metallopeptidase, partial [Clostridia bacterium]|nr:M60 family metallopeptidase [Clostridia bacterium]